MAQDTGIKYSPTAFLIKTLTPTEEQLKKFTTPQIKRTTIGQIEAGSSGGTSLASGQNNKIMDGEVNKFAKGPGAFEDTTSPGVQEMVTTANKGSTLGNIVPEVGKVAGEMAAPAGTTSSPISEAFNRVNPGDVRSGQGIVTTSGGRTYEVQNGQVTKFDEFGRRVPLPDKVTYLSSGPEDVLERDRQHQENMRYARAGYAYDPQERARQLGEINSPQRYVPSESSQYETELAIKNASRGSRTSADKARLADILQRSQQAIARREAALNKPGISPEVAIDIAKLQQQGAFKQAELAQGERRLGQERELRQQELGLRGQQQREESTRFLGKTQLDIAGLNRQYDEAISKAQVEGTPESIEELRKGRSASLVTAAGGDIAKAISSDPSALAILNSNKSAQQKAAELSALHPQYANYISKL